MITLYVDEIFPEEGSAEVTNRRSIQYNLNLIQKGLHESLIDDLKDSLVVRTIIPAGKYVCSISLSNDSPLMKFEDLKNDVMQAQANADGLGTQVEFERYMSCFYLVKKDYNKTNDIYELVVGEP